MYLFGVDFGGTNNTSAVVTEEGKILRSCSEPTPKNFDGIMQVIAHQAHELLQGEPVPYIGIGAPGTINPVEGVIGYW